MQNPSFELIELMGKSYTCAQMLVILALRHRQQENPDLIGAMAGLAYGGGSGLGTCGAFNGAACVLGLYAGKKTDQTQSDPKLALMLGQLSEWFSDYVGEKYNGISCQNILGPENSVKTAMQTCADIVAQTHNKTQEILLENGFDLSGTSA